MFRNKKLFIVFIVSFISFISSGCFFGAFQTAETLGAGNVGSAAYIMIPTYAYSDSTFQDIVDNMSVGGFFQIGATDNFDVGLSFGSAGIGASGKLRLTPSHHKSQRPRKTRSSSSRRHRKSHSYYNPFDIAVLGNVNYDLWHGGLVPKADLIGSIRMGEYFSLYGGGEIFYAPKITELKVTKRYVNKQIFLGLNVRRSEQTAPGLEWIPTSLYIEFGYPLDIEKKTFMFGIGIGGANLPALIGGCLSAMNH